MFTAMISSTVTPKMAARMIRLSTVGIAIPFCHLYIAFGSLKNTTDAAYD